MLFLNFTRDLILFFYLDLKRKIQLVINNWLTVTDIKNLLILFY